MVMDQNDSTSTSKSWVSFVNIMYPIVQWVYQQTKTYLLF